MPTEDAATWERYEALRDELIDLARGAGVTYVGSRTWMKKGPPARAALDDFVRGLLTKPTQAEGGGANG